MQRGTLRDRCAHALLAAALVMLAGCATPKVGSMGLAAPGPTTATTIRSQGIMIRDVNDKRDFQGMTEEPERAIGRTTAILGQPVEEIMLPPGQKVEDLVRQTVANVLTSLGYQLVADEGMISSNDMTIDITIDKFWAEVGTKDGETGMRGTITTKLDVTGPIGKKQTREISVELARRPALGFTAKSWQGFYGKLLNEYAKEAKMELRDLPVP